MLWTVAMLQCCNADEVTGLCHACDDDDEDDDDDDDDDDIDHDDNGNVHEDND